jgi:hydrogenase-4 component F
MIAMAFALILLPVVMAGLAMAIPSNRVRPWLIPLTGLAHLILTIWTLRNPELQAPVGWLVLDPPGRLILLVISLMFFLCGIYAVGYLQYRGAWSNRTFTSCLLAFLGVMSLVVWSHHLGLMWVAIEATSLLTAPLIYFNRTPRSIEATWKYLLVCSVGIALALLGSFFLAYSSFHEGLESTLLFEDLLHHAPLLSKPWLHTAFVLLLVGYGTKMGLAPMHTWKPDAYGEAPGVVGALLAGGLTNCAFLAVLRIYHVTVAAGERAYSDKLVIFLGLLSMLVAGVFMIGQRDLKRMLAYSSVEHMGILILGLGMGGIGPFGSLLHLLNNAMTKGVLFLSVGSIRRAYNSKTIDEVSGAMRRLPLSGTLFLFGFIAITGSPPFGPFVSEFTIITAAFQGGRYVTGALFLLFLLLVFVGMGGTVLSAVQGRPSGNSRRIPYKDGFLTGFPPAVFMGCSLLLGLWIPTPIRTLVEQAAHYLETRP